MALDPFYTILTASLNSDSTVRETLLSVASQTFGSLEHIVMDGGSRDRTVGILREFEKTHCLKWVSEPDSGISAALNKALRLAKGKYFLVLQADDHLADPDILGRIYPLLKEEVPDIYSFPVIRDTDSSSHTLYRPFRVLWWHHFKTIFPHQGAFVHRRVYERIGGFREELKIALDYDFFYRALNARCTVRFGESTVAVMGGRGSVQIRSS